MNGLLPIIRRVRRPLLPVEEARPLQEPPGGERLRRADAADPVVVTVPPEPVAPAPVIKKKTHGTAAKTPDP